MTKKHWERILKAEKKIDEWWDGTLKYFGDVEITLKEYESFTFIKDIQF